MIRIDRDSRGLSTMELAVTLALVAIMATITVPYLGSWLKHYRTVGAAREVTSLLQEVRLKAISTNHEWRLVIDQGTGTLTKQRKDDSGRWIDEEAQKSLPPGVRFTDASGNAASGQVIAIFKPSGKAYCSVNGRYQLAISIYIGGQTEDRYKITILSLTGRIRLYAWTGSNWGPA